MPPKGLYKIPQHHNVGLKNSMGRPLYNSMDYAEAEEPAPIVTNDGTVDDSVSNERAQRKLEKREKKESERLKREAKAAMAAAETEKLEEKQNTPPVTTAPAATSVKKGRSGPRGPYKKREKGPDGTPVSAAKKRKRETEAPVDSPVVTDKGLADVDNWLGPDFKKNMENNKKSLARLASMFDHGVNETATPTDSGKKTVAKSTETDTPKANDTTKKVVKSGESKPKAKKQKLEKTAAPPAVKDVFKVSKKTPVPVPSVASALPTKPKITPVPLPQKSPGIPKRSVSESSMKKTKVEPREPEVLVSETPLSQMSRTPATTPHVQAIPFSLGPAATTPKETGTTPRTHESSPEMPLIIETGSSEAQERVIGSQGSVNPLTSSQANNLTTANLMRFKQPLNDIPKPRPRGRRFVSEAPSTSSSSSATTTRSIRDMLMRPNKPYTAPGDDITPSINRKLKHSEKHDEANLATFTSTFTASQRTINFTDEAGYLEEYGDWLSESEAAGPLPCLKQASGCTAKTEQLLHLPHSDDTAARVANDTTATEIARVVAASTFLRYSIQTRVPVPLGCIKGTFTLYCPKYTATHVDKYGSGQRLLKIIPVDTLDPMAGAYTARLYTPPRSMAYYMETFHVPPHASFRTVTLRTVAERYGMEIMFLGNGYLKLRVDLHLILNGKSAGEVKAAKGKGKERKNKAGEGIWEFLGVHEKAVVWEPVEDEWDKAERKWAAEREGR
ncbi:hypothetical protein ACET3X_008041 [Alternaria dauci]|uniref:Uncharacterized protein n=1 Tax=Alternaria dauci TaxID=48095 RepID=A0ABR3U9Q6_9PLEO